MHKTVEVRQLKNFNEAEFLRDLRMIGWKRVTTHNNPNEMWDFWKHLLTSVIDKHAPLRTKRVKNKRSPWITNELLREIHKRDFLKKLHPQMTLRFGNSSKIQEIRPIT